MYKEIKKNEKRLRQCVNTKIKHKKKITLKQKVRNNENIQIRI